MEGRMDGRANRHDDLFSAAKHQSKPSRDGPLMPARRKVNACRCSCARNRRKQREEGEGEKEEERAEERSNANNASDDPHCARTHNSRDTD